MPLETLSGWPRADDPTVLQVLGLLVGLPLLVFIIVISISKIVTTAHARRGDVVEASDPLWVGAQSAELEANVNPGLEITEQVPAGEDEQAAVREGDVGATTPASTWVARVPAGDSFTPSQLEWIKRAVRNAETISGLTFSLFVGVSEEDSRAYAERLHKALTDPDHSVLVMCDLGFLQIGDRHRHRGSPGARRS